MAGPGFPLNCPFCGDRLAYTKMDGPSHVYACETDGVLLLPPDGRVRRATPDETARILFAESDPPSTIH